VDAFDSVHEFLGVLSGDFHFAGTAQLGSLPKCVVKIRDAFQMLRLEEICPKYEKFILALLCFLFFDRGVSTHRVDVSRSATFTTVVLSEC
jgi:hypothetical protein